VLPWNVDWVIVDCPAGHGALPRLALTACDEVLMPLVADYLSLASIAAALQRFARGGAPGSGGLRLVGILPNFCDPHAAAAAEVAAALAELHTGRVLQTRITVADALRDAPARRGTIFDCEPLSRAALEFASLVEEVRATATFPSIHTPFAVAGSDDAAAAEQREREEGAERSVVSRPDARLD
jgi:chromosome partitioning protein